MTPDQFKEARQALGYTQAELACKLGINARTVQRFEQVGGEGPSGLATRCMELLLDQVKRDAE